MTRSINNFIGTADNDLSILLNFQTFDDIFFYSTAGKIQDLGNLLNSLKFGLLVFNYTTERFFQDSLYPLNNFGATLSIRLILFNRRQLFHTALKKNLVIKVVVLRQIRTTTLPVPLIDNSIVEGAIKTKLPSESKENSFILILLSPDRETRKQISDIEVSGTK